MGSSQLFMGAPLMPSWETVCLKGSNDYLHTGQGKGGFIFRDDEMIWVSEWQPPTLFGTFWR